MEENWRVLSSLLRREIGSRPSPLATPTRQFQFHPATTSAAAIADTAVPMKSRAAVLHQALLRVRIGQGVTVFRPDKGNVGLLDRSRQEAAH
jgi:hypothetical protein